MTSMAMRLRRSTRCGGHAVAVRRLSTAAASSRRRHWLEADCGDVPTQPRPQDLDISEMLRGGHALQVANQKMIGAKLASALRGPATSFSDAHTQTLQELKDLEDRNVERILESAETKGLRFRPSLLIPAVRCSSVTLGTVLSLFGENISRSYISGVKIAIADYYNDQIREIYAHKQEETGLKELFKATRDAELEFVETHSPEAFDPTKEDTDAVRTFATNSTKVLLQVAKTI
ncbi:hypothetical protein Poli38472_012007 [Pythium oligandrum]|uniref:Ubiquinone biosynthesis protein n=1 Tax=Pythium oligandrum TaxID=41045 RepID=A0A8K1CNH3_PYTOL|nr:hypothetical protein Poli38472_012007 [Pythium oligandrum]|eukprot:TMW66891.1 hypothetical protein Poli38472_012007 [Pythium oligandrum]